MNRTTKKVQGQLLDINSKMPLSNGSVTIILIDPQRPNDLPRYEVSLIVDGWKPELGNKSHLLKLGDDLIGEVFIFSPLGELPGVQTHFKVNLQGNIWNNLEWFNKI
jgi:hypothetical protein